MRLSRFLPVQTLLLGLFAAFATAPAAAQTKTFSITERTRVAEGASASLTITLSEDAPAVGVSFTVALGFTGSSTAEAADVMPIDSPVTVPGGARTLGIAIPLTDDDMDEDEETFTVTISTTAEGWTKEGDGKDTAVVAIEDDDNAGVAFIGVNDRRHLYNLTLHLNTPRTYQVVLTSRPIADVTIKASGARITVSPASHTFAASSANDWREPKEFTVTSGLLGTVIITHTVISADSKYASLAHSDWDPGRTWLVNAKGSPTRLTLRADRMPAEGGGVVTVTATLDNPVSMDGATIRLTSSGTANGEGTDYTLSSTTISLLGSQSVGRATITVTDDSADDDGETIVLVASSSNPALTSNTLTLTIEDNDDAGVTVSDATLSVGAGSTATYTVALDSKPMADVTVTPTSGTPANATVSPPVTFQPGDWNSAKEITVRGVKAGMSTVTHVATSRDPRYSSNLSIDSVKVTVTRQAASLSSNANLNGLTASAGALSFDPATMIYSMEVAHDVTSVTLTPRVEDTGKATVTVNGVTVANGSACDAISLKVGENVITVQVMAEDGTTLDHTVTVTRQAAPLSSNVNLSALTASAGDLSFDPATMIYSVEVAHDVTSVNLTPTVEDTGKATVTVNGAAVASGSACDAISLNEGENVIIVRVTAEDGTTLDCTVTVTRQQALSSNANLSALTVSAGELTFDSATTAYALEVAHSVTSLTLAPMVEDTGKATVTVEGKAVESGMPSEVITLEVGENVLTVRVTAEDGTTRDYTLTVTRAADALLVNISSRAKVGMGDNVLIGGFIIADGLQQTLIQAVGPELADRGVANALADPVLTVIDSEGRVLMANDNWEDAQGQLVTDFWEGNPNLSAGSLSAAAVLTLEPGNYTAMVEGKDGTTGVALIEVYQID